MYTKLSTAECECDDRATSYAFVLRDLRTTGIVMPRLTVVRISSFDADRYSSCPAHH